MEALGMIETKGLLLAIESADVMAKCADIKILEKIYVGGGLVSITICGDVGAVKMALEAGVASIKRIDEKSLISYHIIPRPSDELNKIVKITKVEKIPEEVMEEIEEEIIEIIEEPEIQIISKVEIDKLKFEEIEDVLNNLKFYKLRKLAKEYNNFELTSKNVAKLDKVSLMKKILDYYRNSQ
ncbi:Carboxysome shell and ethanolamine utilization microcompartment protein CcmL/EutN [Cetobacterium ceti]|uniref:Carboxysome shell and ethanolamine utilization microcompartment protein CcmL/EutN n=1 Tax=Cetobacterium ceti TaxID=180163 RepID=A0A1T4NMW1_9FUSO|nr:BMC domain-containing protein [Cetobacterium ceti]SJZ80078.1 Carboxysome shell and ethanolamine utilization microcompartment protein CcmL/EutN [Cetobacterium ceti]